MRNSYKKKVTLKTKFPPALSHHFLLDQQKNKYICKKRNCERSKRQISKSHNRNVRDHPICLDFQVKPTKTKQCIQEHKRKERYKAIDKPRGRWKEQQPHRGDGMSNTIDGRRKYRRPCIYVYQSISILCFFFTKGVHVHHQTPT